MLRYENTARRFLQQQAMTGGALDAGGLTGADVNEFLLRECGRVSAGSAKGRVAELRAVLRFLYLRGLTPLRLGTAVPPVGGWRLAALPPHDVSCRCPALLDSCDRSTGVGVRDLAIMMLVARLGLRSIEVARMELGDVDWRAGELVVRGKARRQDRLPLPADVGEAVAAYLAQGRTPAGARRLFLTCRAPRGPIRADLVGDVVERACLRAGLPRVGPHRLRHALAADCSATAPGWSRSARCCATRTWPPPPSTPRSTWTRCGTSPSPGREQPDDRPRADLADYLQLRHSLGHQLADAARLLPGFVAYLDARGLPTVTIEAALAWAQQARRPTGSSVCRGAADDRRPRLRPLPVRHRPRTQCRRRA